LFVIALGILWTLENLGSIDASGIWRWWPVVVIVIGLQRALQSRGSRVGGGVITGIGIVLLFHELELLDFDIWELWPLVLVLIGGSMVWGALTRGRDPKWGSGGSDTWVQAVAILGGSNRQTNSQEFRGGEATAILGGCDIDLTHASVAGGEAVIDIFAFWGGIDLRVPEDWTVILEASAILAGIEDKTRKPPTATKRLVVKGLAIMGGVDIKN
jgi:predicted membrane protein